MSECSVVVPAHNAAPFVAEAIESVLAQTGVDWDLTVVDDGSTDATAERIRGYRDARVRFLQQPRSGAPAARNRGLRASTGALVVFLDADDRLTRGALARLCDRLARAPRAVVAYGEVVPMDAGGRVYGPGRAPWFGARPSGPALRALLRRAFIASPGAACVRRSALEAAGAFREDLARAQDWELWCRLACRGDFVYVPPPPVLERRVHGGGIGATVGTSVEPALRSIEVVFGSPEVRERFPPHELARLRRRQEASAYAVVGTECLKLRRFGEARRALARSLRRDPRGLRELLLLGAAGLHWLPPSLERRLK